jgi:RNA polymerase sigma-70 factor (ECF subfamily)
VVRLDIARAGVGAPRAPVEPQALIQISDIPDSIGDADAVARYLDGDQSAFDDLYRRRYSQVYGLAYQLTNDRERAEDLAQTAFLKVIKSLQSLRDGQSVLKYLYRIVVNQVRDEAKGRKRNPIQYLRDLVGRTGDRGEPIDKRPQADAILESRERNEVLRARIAELPTDFKAVLALHHFQAMPVQEIAQLLGLPEGTVKSRLGRARERLRETMRDWLVEQE